MAVIGIIAILVNGYQFTNWQLFLETWWIFIVSLVAFLGATHYLFHQHHYILALLFAFTQLLFAFSDKKRYCSFLKHLVHLEIYLYLVC